MRPTLRRYGETAALAPAQKTAQTRFAQTVAVERRGIEVANARGIGPFENRFRELLADVLIHPADTAGAESDVRAECKRPERDGCASTICCGYRASAAKPGRRYASVAERPKIHSRSSLVRSA